jgi:hypothetical protein
LVVDHIAAGWHFLGHEPHDRREDAEALFYNSLEVGEFPRFSILDRGGDGITGDLSP